MVGIHGPSATVMITGIPDEERLLEIKARAMPCASVWRGAGVAGAPGPGWREVRDRGKRASYLDGVAGRRSRCWIDRMSADMNPLPVGGDPIRAEPVIVEDRALRSAIGTRYNVAVWCKPDCSVAKLDAQCERWTKSCVQGYSETKDRGSQGSQAVCRSFADFRVVCGLQRIGTDREGVGPEPLLYGR